MCLYKKNNLMRLSLTLFLFLFVQVLGFGQRIFRDGYVVKNNGDTLNGLVQFEAKQKGISECFFKRFDIANVVMYTPDMLKGFGYKKGNNYESFNINSELVFLECLVKGSVSLYSDGKRLLLHTMSDGFVVLKNNEVFRVDGTNITTISGYLMQINGNLSNVNIPKEITAAEADIVPIVVDLNSNISSNYKVYNRKYDDEMFAEATMLTGANMISYGVISVLSFSSSKLISQSSNYFENISDFKYSRKDFSFGLFYNYKLSRMSNNLSFQSEIHFQKQNNYFYCTISRVNPIQTYRMDLFADNNLFRIPIFIKYSYHKINSESFFNFGLVVNYSITNYSKGTLESESSSQVYQHGSDDFENKVKNANLSIYTGVGLKYYILKNKYLVFEGRYEIGKGNKYSFDFNYIFAPKFELAQNTSSFHLVIGLGI